MSAFWMSQTPNDIALAETFHHSEDISGVRQGAGLIQLTEAHYAPFVDDDYCPLAGPALLVPKVIRLADLALGMEVGQLGIGKATERCAPSTVGRNCVAAYAQDLGIIILEPLVFLPERGRLRGSTRGEVEYVERKNNYLLALVVGQGNVPIGGGKFEIGGYIANFCRHIPAFIK